MKRGLCVAAAMVCVTMTAVAQETLPPAIASFLKDFYIKENAAFKRTKMPTEPLLQLYEKYFATGFTYTEVLRDDDTKKETTLLNGISKKAYLDMFKAFIENYEYTQSATGQYVPKANADGGSAEITFGMRTHMGTGWNKQEEALPMLQRKMTATARCTDSVKVVGGVAQVHQRRCVQTLFKK